MSVAYQIAAGLLAVSVLATGATKLLRTRETLRPVRSSRSSGSSEIH